MKSSDTPARSRGPGHDGQSPSRSGRFLVAGVSHRAWTWAEALGLLTPREIQRANAITRYLIRRECL